MSDLISRQAFIDSLAKTYHAAEKWGQDATDSETKIRAESSMAMLIEVKLRLENFPSAEPERQGRWEFIGDQMFRCSECRHTFTQKFLEGWRESVHEPLFPPHCPNCGSYNGGESK